MSGPLPSLDVVPFTLRHCNTELMNQDLGLYGTSVATIKVANFGVISGTSGSSWFSAGISDMRLLIPTLYSRPCARNLDIYKVLEKVSPLVQAMKDITLLMLALKSIAAITELGPTKVSCSQFFSMIPDIAG
ncbi:hypothetical protein Vadar_000320 [Vaccinium darrowii]|uniref:Uncharacterized protein n=1 Tax=Vaccinium darrowii TaxID=229202 RepID=A0ACB7YJB3_9ERIC|nr:hypothetical protein Vadar_000320 [Vaccinium darrowii]